MQRGASEINGTDPPAPGEEFFDEPVLGGTWMYAGTVPRRVMIVARNYDIEFEHRRTSKVRREATEPRPFGPDCRLYYVEETSSPAHQSLQAAIAWVDQQPWGPVVWDSSRSETLSRLPQGAFDRPKVSSLRVFPGDEARAIEGWLRAEAEQLPDEVRSAVLNALQGSSQRHVWLELNGLEERHLLPEAWAERLKEYYGWIF